jgi:sigma-B regulation protein RsbU (phosphoserine phosphatase)
VGIVPSEYPSAAFRLSRGDRLLLLTDGVFDAKNRAGLRLGFDAVVKFVTGHMHEEQLIERLVDFADDFSGGGDRADDLTIVELKWGV